MMTLDEARLEEFVNRFVGDLGAALHATTVVVGDELGLYRALAELGPTDAAALATATGCDTRLVQEWLDAQFVAGYCHFSPQTAAYWLSPEQAMVLADPSSAVFLVGSMSMAASTAKDEEKVRAAFRTGAGLGWADHHHDLFHGTERFNRTRYAASLVSDWVPALDGVGEKLDHGATVADIGCGHGGSAILLARAHPSSSITGFDPHRASIDIARKRAAEAGVSERVRFEVASAQEVPGTGYDLVCTFDSLGHMGDPHAAAAHFRAALDPDGTWLLVEPMAGDRLDADVTPVGRIFHALSAAVATPAAQAQPGGQGLGSQVRDQTLAELAAEAGFTRFRRAASTPFNRVFEARP